MRAFFAEPFSKIVSIRFTKGSMTKEGCCTTDGSRCFQLMETEQFELFQEWTKNWGDVTRFEILEVGEKPEKGNSV